jgi:predicted DNA-binding protein (MmcQ/YjbR family)
MNKKNWITVLLDGTVAKQNVKKLIKMSFDLTA